MIILTVSHKLRRAFAVIRRNFAVFRGTDNFRNGKAYRMGITVHVGE